MYTARDKGLWMDIISLVNTPTYTHAEINVAHV